VISEGSCDTEDWSNAENAGLVSKIWSLLNMQAVVRAQVQLIRSISVN